MNATTHAHVADVGRGPSPDDLEDEPEDFRGKLSAAADAGREADSIREALTLSGVKTGHAHNLAAGAMTLLITLMIILLAALVGGKFADAIPSGSTFASAIGTTTDNAGTAFVIFGVSLLAIPTTAVLAYMISRLGGFLGMAGGGLRRPPR